MFSEAASIVTHTHTHDGKQSRFMYTAHGIRSFITHLSVLPHIGRFGTSRLLHCSGPTSGFRSFAGQHTDDYYTNRLPDGRGPYETSGVLCAYSNPVMIPILYWVTLRSDPYGVYGSNGRNSGSKAASVSRPRNVTAHVYARS